MTHRLVIDRRLHIPKTLMSRKIAERRYRVDLYDDEACNKCENLPDRGNDICHTCQYELARYKLYQEEETSWSVPAGDTLALSRILDKKEIDYEIVDKRKTIPFVHPIRFTGKLFGANHIDVNGHKRPNQIRLVKRWLRYKNGILQAAPRSGKTVCSIFLACHLKQRTVIMADRKELLKQFYRAIMGDETKNRAAMTNIPELRVNTGREIVRLAEKPKDLTNLDDVDILLLNYQKAVRDPKRMRSIIDGNYSFLIVDEAHGSGATGYLRVVSACDVKHRLSLTATPKRKDQRHILINRIMGPVVAKSDSVSLIPRIELKVSKVRPIRAYRSWPHAMNWLCSFPELRAEMLRELFKDLRAGHGVILVPLDRKAHIDAMVNMVNQQARTNNRKRGEDWPEDLAIKFYDGVDRDEVLDQVDKPGPTVLFAMRSMIKQGIDFDRPSMIYVYIPMSASKKKNIGAPMFHQLSNRVCTPYNKPEPVVKLWAHNIGMFQSCTTGLWFREIWNNRWNGRTGRYRADKETLEQVKELKSRKSSADTSRMKQSFSLWVK